MSDNPLDDVLSVVDRLTQPHTVSSWIHDEDGSRIVRVETDGLLKQLRDAIVGGIGGHAGSSLGSERLPFDSGALELYQAIEKTIGEWFVGLTRKPVYLELEKTLRQWYVAFAARADRTPDEVTRFHLLKLSGWAAAIEGKFDPPRTLELTVNEYEWQKNPEGEPLVDAAGVAIPEVKRDRRGKPTLDRDGREVKIVRARHMAACPREECGAAVAFDPKNGDRMPALVLEYREAANDTIEGSRVLCRACGFVWTGGKGVREVSYAIHLQEDRINTPRLAVNLS